jgi:hypothetical protein
MRTDLTIDYLQNTDVDLFCPPGECHCASHQLWHRRHVHPMHDAAMVKALGGDPMKAGRADAALEKFWAQSTNRGTR